MTVAIAGRTPATFEIKSANLPLVALLLKSPDLQLLAQELKARFGDIPDFFDHDPLVVDLAPLAGAQVDFAGLLALLRPYRVMPVAVKGGSDEQMAAAPCRWGWRRPTTPWRCASRAPPPQPSPRGGGSNSRSHSPLQCRCRLPAPSSSIARCAPASMRSMARGRDLIVLAMVNPGAEVIADGHIHVYAPLRGKAIAGARGDAEARILTLCQEPELVSIAGVYRTSENPLPDSLHGKPAQIRLADDKLVMAPLNT